MPTLPHLPLLACAVGLRGYLATRQLTLAGLSAVNVSGGYKNFAQMQATKPPAAAAKL